MNEFTPEWIEKVRLSSHLIEPPAAEVIGECLDEIERLKKLSDGLYLLLVDNAKSKRLADIIIKHVYSDYNTKGGAS